MRWKCVCTYDGTNFEGWQSQANRQGVQDHLEDRIAITFKRFIRIHGCSRTDAGVHARGQVFHFDADWTHGAECLQKAINSRLDLAVQILSISPVEDTFHARYSVRQKRYRYYFQLHPSSPFDYRYVWAFQGKHFDIKAIEDVLPLFVGKHDFRGFAGHVLSGENTIKQLTCAQILEEDGRYVIETIGSGYLYRMMRMIVGACVMCGYGKINKNFIRRRLNLENLSIPIVTAPAQGLFLEEIYY